MDDFVVLDSFRDVNLVLRCRNEAEGIISSFFLVEVVRFVLLRRSCSSVERGPKVGKVAFPNVQYIRALERVAIAALDEMAGVTSLSNAGGVSPKTFILKSDRFLYT